VQWVGVIECKSNIFIWKCKEWNTSKHVTVYQDSNAMNLSYYWGHSVSPLSFWHATDAYNTSMLSSNLLPFSVLFGGNSVGQLN
jgi:hypothetical protein